jgi:S-DNA-T family DNA segregation ATPase FtsK/SpoIIIE
MHLILATQRPQANVVTGLIKSNMPSRIAFKVSSGMDSRIVMDQKGAELLLGQGDMLFLSPRSSELTRAQGTLVDDKEIRRVVKFLREIAQPSYERSLMQIKTGAAAGTVADDTDEAPADPNAVNNGYAVAQQDDLFEKAVDVVMETKVGSVSMLQRRLAIGYTRSARLIELMGHVGILGAHKGTQAREVVMGEEEWQAMKAQMAADREAGTTTSVPFEANVAGEGAKVPVDDDEARLG